MLNFRNTNITFIVIVLLLGGLATRYHVPVYVYVLAAILYSGILFYGSYYVGSNFFMKVLCSAKTDARQIAISFDDGPAAAYTAAILQVLKAEQVPAVFFCIGKNMDGNESLLQQIVDEGHIIGNHSYSHHFWFDLFSTKKMMLDVQQMSATVKKITGFTPRLFRPPYGVTTPNMKTVMQQGGFTAIGWNIRSLDTVIKEEEKLLQKISSKLQPGAVVLLHDTSKTTLQVLPRFIAAARSKGYEFVRMDKLLNVMPYA
ncbi:MAG: polysaccharide deacetylase family protein [Chitinophagaceae bacterium]